MSRDVEQVLRCILCIDDVSRFFTTKLNVQAMCLDPGVIARVRFVRAFFNVFKCYPSKRLVYEYFLSGKDFAQFILSIHAPTYILFNSGSCDDAMRHAKSSITTSKQVYDEIRSRISYYRPQRADKHDLTLLELFFDTFTNVDEFQNTDNVLDKNIRNAYSIVQTQHSVCVIALHDVDVIHLDNVMKTCHDVAPKKIHVFGVPRDVDAPAHYVKHQYPFQTFPLMLFGNIVVVKEGNCVEVNNVNLQLSPLSNSITVNDGSILREVLKVVLKQPREYQPQCIAFWMHVSKLWSNVSCHVTSVTRFEPKSKNRIIAIDSRKNSLLVLACILTMYNVNVKHWSGLTVYCDENSAEYYKQVFAFCPDVDVQIIHIPSQKFSMDDYNDILKSEKLWRGLKERGVEKVLTVQDDGFLIRKGVEHFLKYDYVGAPWVMPQPLLQKHTNPDLVGNGGLSLRSVACMLDIVTSKSERKYDVVPQICPSQIPEDVFFSHYAYVQGYKVCPRSEATQFASEEVCTPSCIGVHKPWPYLHLDDIAKLFTQS